MEFSLFVPCHRFDSAVSEREVLGLALRSAEMADEAGFRTVWFPEHHMVQYIACPSPLQLAVAAAQRTKRVRVGTAIIVLPYYDPRRLAGEIGMADVLSEGRLEVGFGRGAFQYEFDRFGIDPGIGTARLHEGMDIIEGLLSQEDFEYRGETISFGPSTSVPRPLQKPHPPIWISGRSPESIRWLLGRGYNQLATPWRESFSYVEENYGQFTRLRDEVAPKGKQLKYGISRMSFVGETDGEARDAMRDVAVNHRAFTRLFTNTAAVKGGFVQADPVDNEFTEEALFNNLVAGSPETVIEKLKAYEALGLDEFIMYAGFPLDQAKTIKSIRLFAERVMPAFEKGTTKGLKADDGRTAAAAG